MVGKEKRKRKRKIIGMMSMENEDISPRGGSQTNYTRHTSYGLWASLSWFVSWIFVSFWKFCNPHQVFILDCKIFRMVQKFLRRIMRMKLTNCMEYTLYKFVLPPLGDIPSISPYSSQLFFFSFFLFSNHYFS